MDSTEMIALWHQKKEILKEKDFRNDQWRLAREAFFMGLSCGYGECKEKMLKEAVDVEVTETCGIPSIWLKMPDNNKGDKLKITFMKEDRK